MPRVRPAVAVLALALSLTAAASASLSSLGGPFVDQEGDSGNAPDVGLITVSATEGLLEFSVTLPNRPEGLKKGELVVVVLDTDHDQTTGCRGFELTLAATSEGASFGRCQGGSYDYSALPPASFTGHAASGTAYFAVSALEAGVHDGLHLQAGSVAVLGSGREYDDAPNAGYWAYALDGQTWRDEKAPKLQALKAQGRAGKARLRFRLADDSGRASVTLAVYRGQTRALRRAYKAFAVDGSEYYIDFRAPGSFKGRFCLTAADAAGNQSRSCAPLSMS